jgi:Icc-related predicted phosphoesterase
MRIVFISDTHTRHQEVRVPDGDLLVHAGDISGRGGVYEISRFMAWMEDQPHQHKVMIAGNHDFLAERNPEDFLDLVPKNVTYLNDSSIEIDGLKIWGSPVQPWFHDWAFNRQRGPEIDVHWQLIPADTDLLITHGPPYGILDATTKGEKVGCEDLLRRVQQIKPKIHVFGHIHEAYGQLHQNGTHFINASSLNHLYMPVFDPIVVDLKI